MRAGRLLGIGLCASVALTGCSKREDAKLAEFKDRVITVKDFETAYNLVDAAYLPKKTGDEGKREFLTTMLNKEVMAEKADELGYDKDPSVAQGLDNFKRMSLQVAFLKREVTDKITVSDAEVKRHYDNQNASVSIKQILVDTEEEANAAYEALQGGLDFESACRQFSKSDDAAAGGNVMSASYGGLVAEVQERMFSTPVGEYSEPMFTAHGWVIVKVITRNEGKKPKSFEEVKDKMRTEVLQSKEAVALNKFTDKMRDDYGVTWDYGTMMIVFNALPPDRPFEEAPARDQEVYPLLYFDADDLDKPVVTYKDKTITVKDFSDMYDHASFYTRPRRNLRLGGIRGFLTEVIMNEISAEIVGKSGIENDPEIAATIKRKKEEIMVGLLFEDMVNRQTAVSIDEMHAFYNDNLESFRTPEKRKFGVILAGDMESAHKARQAIQEGTPIASVANTYSMDEESVSRGGVTEFMTQGENAEIDKVGFGMQRLGDLSEPFQTSRGWMVLRLLEREDAKVFAFDEVQAQIEAHLRNKANDNKLELLLAKWKEEYGVVIHDKNIKKIRVTERSVAPAEPQAAAGI